MDVISAVRGQQATLPCFSASQEPVDWTFSGIDGDDLHYLYTNGKIVWGLELRLSVNTTNAGGHHLTISHVEPRDSGTYTCTEDGGFGQKHYVRLNVTSFTPGSARRVSSSSPATTTTTASTTDNRRNTCDNQKEEKQGGLCVSSPAACPVIIAVLSVVIIVQLLVVAIYYSLRSCARLKDRYSHRESGSAMRAQERLTSLHGDEIS